MPQQSHQGKWAMACISKVKDPQATASGNRTGVTSILRWLKMPTKGLGLRKAFRPSSFGVRALECPEMCR